MSKSPVWFNVPSAVKTRTQTQSMQLGFMNWKMEKRWSWKKSALNTTSEGKKLCVSISPGENVCLKFGNFCQWGRLTRVENQRERLESDFWVPKPKEFRVSLCCYNSQDKLHSCSALQDTLSTWIYSWKRASHLHGRCIYNKYSSSA